MDTKGLKKEFETMGFGHLIEVYKSIVHSKIEVKTGSFFKANDFGDMVPQALARAKNVELTFYHILRRKKLTISYSSIFRDIKIASINKEHQVKYSEF
jgi:hypothetical protein